MNISNLDVGATPFTDMYHVGLELIFKLRLHIPGLQVWSQKISQTRIWNKELMKTI